ncbi:MAG: hypothetical protein U0Q22_19040 [Acidimicrobiales bacterium]
MIDRPRDPLNDTPEFVALRESLVAAAAEHAHEPTAPAGRSARRPATQRRLLLSAAAVVLVVAAVVAALVSVGTKGAAAGVTVERRGDRVRVVLDGSIDVGRVRKALADAGVTATVLARTTGPSLQNRFLGSVNPSDAKLEGGDGKSSAVATLPAGSRAVLLLGVAGKPGEPYDVPTDASADGEPLAGLDLRTATVSAVRTAPASSPDVEVTYRASDGKPVANPSAGARVLNALALSDRSVVVFLQ